MKQSEEPTGSTSIDEPVEGPAGLGASTSTVSDQGSASSTEPEGPPLRVPKANSLARLRDVLDQVAAGRRRAGWVGDRTELNEETVRDYFDLAGWLGLVETESAEAGESDKGELESVREPLRLTELGRRFTGDPGSARYIAKRRLETTPLLRAVRKEQAWPSKPGEALRRVVRRRTTLAPGAARRRAEGVRSLLAQLGLPDAEASTEDFEIFEARRLPIGVLDPPGGLGATIEELELQTVGDVLALEVEDLEALPGVGPRRGEQLRDLYDRAWRASGSGGEAVPDPLASDVADALREGGWSARDPWRELPLEIPTRIENALQETGVDLTGELVAIVAHLGLSELPNVGPKSARAWRERLELLATDGWDAYQFGPGGRPETVSALIEQLMSELSPRNRQILRGRHLEGRTLGEIGEPLGLTRERIRQILQSTMEDFADTYSTVATHLTGPLRYILEGDGIGLLHRDRARATVGTDDPFHIVLVLRVAGVADASIWKDHFIRTESVGEIRSRVEQLERRFKETNRLFLKVDDALKFADELGFELSSAELEDLLRVASDAEPDTRRRFRNPKATKGDRIAEALREARRPLQLDELARAFAGSYAHDDEPSDRSAVQPYCKKHPHIYTVGNGEYVHRRSLPVDEETLEEITDRCVDFLRGRRRAVSTQWLLEQLDRTDLATGGRLEGLNPTLLRDILFRHEHVGTSVNSYNVAWKPTYDFEDETLSDRLERIMRRAGEPMDLDEIESAFPEEFYVATGSIEYTLGDMDAAVELGSDRYAHTHVVGVDDEGRRAVVEAVEATLPGPESVVQRPSGTGEGTVWSAQAVWDEIRHWSELETLRQRVEEHDQPGDELLYGLVHDDERLVGEQGQLLARRDAVEAQQLGLSETTHLLVRAVLEVVVDRYPVGRREVAQILEDEQGVGRDVTDFGRHLSDLVEAGLLERLGSGLYFPSGVAEAELFEQFSRADRDLVELTDRSDFAEFPDDELWLLARYFYNADRLTAAKRALDVLVDRDGPDEAYVELHEQVETTLRELLG